MDSRSLQARNTAQPDKAPFSDGSGADLLEACKRAVEILNTGAPGWGVAKDILNAAISKAQGACGCFDLTEIHLIAQILAEPANEDGWRAHPDELTATEVRILKRWGRWRWIEFEETPVLRVTRSGMLAFDAALSPRSARHG